MNHPKDEHPDGPDPIRDMVWEEAIMRLRPEPECCGTPSLCGGPFGTADSPGCFESPAPRFGEITTDYKLDNVVARNDQSKSVPDAGESIPASASSPLSSRKPPPIHPMAGMVTWITPSLGTSPDPEEKTEP